MDPLLIVIIGFGLIFVVTASLGNGLAITVDTIRASLAGHSQLNVMLIQATSSSSPRWSSGSSR